MPWGLNLPVQSHSKGKALFSFIYFQVTDSAGGGGKSMQNVLFGDITPVPPASMCLAAELPEKYASSQKNAWQYPQFDHCGCTSTPLNSFAPDYLTL